MADDLKVVNSAPLPGLTVRSSAPLPQQQPNRTGQATMGGTGFEDVSTAQAPGVLGAVQEAGAGAAIGVGREAAKTLTGIPEAISPGSTGTLGKIAHTQPEGLAEKAGGLAENVAEFATGETALKGAATLVKAHKLMPGVLALIEQYPKAAKILLGAGAAGTVGAAQGAVKGAGEGRAAEGAIAGGAGGAVAGGALGSIEAAAGSKLARAWINRSLGASARDVTYGNPAKALLDENIANPLTGDLEAYKSALHAGKSTEEAAQAAGGRIAGINAKINEIKPQLEAALDASPAHISLVKPIDQTIVQATVDIENNPAMTATEKKAAVTKLEELHASIKEWAGKTSLRPADLNELKSAIGDRISWGGTSAIGDEVKPIYRRLYGNIKEAVNKAVPEAAGLNERLTNLLAAWKDVVPLARKEEVGSGTGVTAGFVWDVLRRIEAELGRIIPAIKATVAAPTVKTAAGVAGSQAGRATLPDRAEGHVRFTASDGSVHDVPSEHLDKAKQIDPGLKILEQ